ncbi:MAG: hypothetical protein BGO82_06955 [Devosia sp. 67-54]|uniref:hypothetical protein n=1 Tax=unclassified Devosia TaxID=196773 RepID=UPI000968ADC1|nr:MULTISPECIES: hypothetical protein [unclassified Devosia]MBN9307051.1 hypothetical protein [Devosia sp.]OJX19466.1 MAG: hypothetical protein BGO82_06955 [Devosia sp. 67-54]
MQTLPSDIRTGMTVYDSRHHAIGKVDDFKFSENELEPDVQPADIDGTDRRDARETILASIAEAFGREELPETLRDRLLTEGYIRLDTKGLLARDRFILPDQIASVGGDEIMLNVSKDDLIKRP